jgi:2-keto-4-pentenoate hydratase/2-oxohepta-3-ene-1,7-dioic acid hydratase in catechol pathway
MIFSLPEIVAFVSKNFTLMPGDIIATGTPAGVGRIKSGDRVEVEIEGIGTLENPVEDE